MERRIDRAVDHDGGDGINAVVPDNSLTPLAKAGTAAAQALSARRDG